jgi:hypothetical protein
MQLDGLEAVPILARAHTELAHGVDVTPERPEAPLTAEWGDEWDRKSLADDAAWAKLRYHPNVLRFLADVGARLTTKEGAEGMPAVGGRRATGAPAQPAPAPSDRRPTDTPAEIGGALLGRIGRKDRVDRFDDAPKR